MTLEVRDMTKNNREKPQRLQSNQKSLDGDLAELHLG